MRPILVGCVALVLTSLPRLSPAQESPSGSVLERTPNITGGWTGQPGTLQFNFAHRFRLLDPPGRQLTNVPTILLAYRPAFPVLIGINYASSSLIVPNALNEFELFGRAAALSSARGAPLDLALQLSYHQAAKSIDAEATVGRQAGPLRLFGVARYLSNGYATDTARVSVGGGARLRLSRHVALAGDVTSLLERRASEEVAWGAALQLAIPYSPHTFSLQVTNTTTATLQGSSRGTDIRRVGFEFTIPITLRRYFGGGGRRRAAEGGEGAPQVGNATAAEIRGMAFTPRLDVGVGTTIVWTNRDQVEHTVTADDGTWDSGPIAPGQTWRRTFEQTGEFSYHCTPHPFMRGVVVVR